LSGKQDLEVFHWAQTNQAVIITYDEDFTDIRFLPKKKHYGIIRLRVFPPTIEETRRALIRVFEEVTEAELLESVIVIGRNRIRIRPIRQTSKI